MRWGAVVGLVVAAGCAGDLEHGGGAHGGAGGIVGSGAGGVGGGAGGGGGAAGLGAAAGGEGGSGGGGGHAGSGAIGGTSGSGGFGGTGGQPTAAVIEVVYDVGFGHHISVRGSGDGLRWDQGRACTWSAGHRWRCVLSNAAVPVVYKPLVDDAVWAKGHNFVWGDAPAYPVFYAEHGRVVLHADVSSAFLGNSRTVAVYLPPGYDENPAAEFAVLVMQDGQNLFDPASAAFGVAWEVDDALDGLTSHSGIVPAIVVAPYHAGAARLAEYTPSDDPEYGGGQADAYLDFVLEELLPFARARYRIRPGRVGLAGSSLGGLLSLYGCWTRPESFDRCGVMSPSLWWDDAALFEEIVASDAPKRPLRFYLDSGDSGPSEDGRARTQALSEALLAQGWQAGIDLLHVVGEDQAHEEAAWAARTPAALDFLLDDPLRQAP